MIDAAGGRPGREPWGELAHPVVAFEVAHRPRPRRSPFWPVIVDIPAASVRSCETPPTRLDASRVGLIAIARPRTICQLRVIANWCGMVPAGFAVSEAWGSSPEGGTVETHARPGREAIMSAVARACASLAAMLTSTKPRPVAYVIDARLGEKLRVASEDFAVGAGDRWD
jgi:hypothetical protein